MNGMISHMSIKYAFQCLCLTFHNFKIWRQNDVIFLGCKLGMARTNVKFIHTLPNLFVSQNSNFMSHNCQSQNCQISDEFTFARNKVWIARCKVKNVRWSKLQDMKSELWDIKSEFGNKIRNYKKTNLNFSQRFWH